MSITLAWNEFEWTRYSKRFQTFQYFLSCLFLFVFFAIRQVSKAEGSSLAHFYNAAFFETSAAEEFSSVERVFHEAIRGMSCYLFKRLLFSNDISSNWLVEVIREQERYMPIRSLYIANDESKNSFLTINGTSRFISFGYCE